MRSIRQSVFGLIVCGAAALLGCGNDFRVYPTQVMGSDGSPIYVEELLEIAEDASLTEEEQAQRLRDLGIEDEELIRAILGV